VFHHCAPGRFAQGRGVCSPALVDAAQRPAFDLGQLRGPSQASVQRSLRTRRFPRRVPTNTGCGPRRDDSCLPQDQLRQEAEDIPSPLSPPRCDRGRRPERRSSAGLDLHEPPPSCRSENRLHEAGAPRSGIEAAGTGRLHRPIMQAMPRKDGLCHVCEGYLPLGRKRGSAPGSRPSLDHRGPNTSQLVKLARRPPWPLPGRNGRGASAECQRLGLDVVTPSRARTANLVVPTETATASGNVFVGIALARRFNHD
jgi:hypothetical protein